MTKPNNIPDENSPDADSHREHRAPDILRQKLAIEHGLPIEAAAYLRGDTAEDITADIKSILPLFKSTAPPSAAGFDGGAGRGHGVGTAGPDMNTALRRAAGRLA